MTVGEALAEARTRAGLSIDDVSERSRIRQVVIHGIEQDDYEVCGGELYVRGYLRVIADAIGIDAQPLIDSYDSSGRLEAVIIPARHRAPEPPPQARPARPGPVPARPLPSRSASRGPQPAPPRPAAPRGAGGPRTSSGPMPPAHSGPFPSAGTGPLPSAPSGPFPAAQSGPMPSVGTGPMPSARPGGPAPARRGAPLPGRSAPAASARPGTLPRRPRQGTGPMPAAESLPQREPMTRGVPVPAAAGAPVGAPESVAEMMRNAPPGGFPHAPAGMRETSTDLPSHSYQPGKARRRPLPPPARLASPPRPARGNWLREHRWAAMIAVAVVVVIAVVVASTQLLGGSGGTASGAAAAGLPVSFDVAYGPNGVADGDNANSAAYPVTSGDSRPWTTRQYSSARFGGKQSGTGLLLDMGGSVTVSSVALSLGSGSGASLQLQLGKAVTELSTAASVSDAGGSVTLRPGKPVTARYLLVWITRLPRAGNGQYQASVYRITVNGHP